MSTFSPEGGCGGPVAFVAAAMASASSSPLFRSVVGGPRLLSVRVFLGWGTAAPAMGRQGSGGART
jgi:hypothetical protein